MSMLLKLECDVMNASAWIDVVDLSGGLSGILFAYRTIVSRDVGFTASVLSVEGDENGWSILKFKHNYVLFFICSRSVSGFQGGEGVFYAYKNGTDNELIDWPGVEFGKIPKHCFLDKSVFESLLLSLYKSDNPSDGAGFLYSDEYWERVS